MTSIFAFSAKQMNGRPMPLKKFKGKAMLLVNTASACGFTPQFAGLEQLHRQYGDRGLVVIGFPCNQFGAQDPGDGAVRQRYALAETPASLARDVEAALGD